MRLPYDIIYNIFFLIDDYTTLLNIYVLNKFFYYNYMHRYNKTYKHKFYVLFKDMFTFLSLLPNLKAKDDDIQLFMCINTMCIDAYYKQVITRDILFIYRMYKSIIFEESTKRLGITLAPDLTNVILIQGPNHLDRNISVKFNKNKITLYLPSYSRLLELNVALNFLYLRHQFTLIENTI